MKTEKLSFKNIKDVLSRDEMKQIMAGSYSTSCTSCYERGTSYSCEYTSGLNKCTCSVANSDGTGCKITN